MNFLFKINSILLPVEIGGSFCHENGENRRKLSGLSKWYLLESISICAQISLWFCEARWYFFSKPHFYIEFDI